METFQIGMQNRAPDQTGIPGGSARLHTEKANSLTKGAIP